jgi:hypothetical protein
MHGPESLPYRPGRATPRKPTPDDIEPGSGSKIFQPTSSREAVLGRSTGGAPGHRHRDTAAGGRSGSLSQIRNAKLLSARTRREMHIARVATRRITRPRID